MTRVAAGESTTALPTRMRAVVLESLAPDLAGVRLDEVPIPAPAAGEVLVRVRAASVGFPDLLMTHGGYQFKPELPFVLGSEACGEIVALGAGVLHLRIGAAVVAARAGGALAEYASYPADLVRPWPASFTDAEGAAFSAAYLTAYVGLVVRARLVPGEWVLVHGAAGGVGLAAVDLAKALGARVIAASASDRKLQAIARLYAPDALLNTSGSFAPQVRQLTDGRGADVVYDPVGGDVFDESTHCIAFDGRLLVVGFASGRIPAIKVNHPLIKGYSVVGVRAGEYTRRHPQRAREIFSEIWRLAAEHKVRPHVHAELPLERWREAFELMQHRELIGRVVIRP